MMRINRYARGGSIASLFPNPLTRVDFITPTTPRAVIATSPGSPNRNQMVKQPPHAQPRK